MENKKITLWTKFYMELANKVLMYKNDRQSLILLLKSIYFQTGVHFTYMENGEIIGDICPFTFFASFNKMIPNEKRIAILNEIKTKMEIEEAVPIHFDGIPLVTCSKECFFTYKYEREEEDIDNLWELFESAIYYSDAPTEQNREKFIGNYNQVLQQKGMPSILTIGLFWCRPYMYLSLDDKIKKFIKEQENTLKSFCEILVKSDKNILDGKEYLSICEQGRAIIKNKKIGYHSFPEISYFAWKSSEKSADIIGENKKYIPDSDFTFNKDKKIVYSPYTKEDFLNEVFMSEEQYDKMVRLLIKKKNIILMGAPGVGKTFTACRLAYSILKEKDKERVMMIQFHQSYSYEDFIMGYRPTKEGFELSSGPFYEFCKKAQKDRERNYFFIIDEINRGNLSKIFGELLMLMEADKRGESVRLLYSKELFMVPENVFLIGMMNTADRSLAMIDYALRRRFLFYELKPAFDSEGFQYRIKIANNKKFDSLIKIVKELNEFIERDETLGSSFVIGHSYFCVSEEVSEEEIDSIIQYELIPLISEYWFDEQSKVQEWIKKLYGALNDKN